MLQYKLVVTDLDATLLDSRGEITENTRRAVRAYQESGGIFTIATGRMEGAARRFAEQVGVKVPIISFNGGKIVSLQDGAVIYETFLDPDCGTRAYLALRALKKDVIVYLNQERYVAERNAVIEKYIARVQYDVSIVDDIHAIVGAGDRRLKKLLTIDPKQETDLILNTIRPIFGALFNCVKSDPEYYEILPPNTSKGDALVRLARHLGVPIETTVAVGDHLNDIPMFEAAGFGVAVANATPEALLAADYVTASNDDDGIAVLLQKIIAGEPLG
ncbi:MAG: HAD family hydrolase [Clostridiales bacterium]|nr:HAD family hydrolase [Clostridiales bacterium]